MGLMGPLFALYTCFKGFSVGALEISVVVRIGIFVVSLKEIYVILHCIENHLHIRLVFLSKHASK